jgi:hypothetical protein
MNESNKNTNTQAEPKVVVSYIVSRFDNGDIRVENNPIEGITVLNSEALYKDVEDVAETIKNRRIENATYRGLCRFYADMEKREQAAVTAAGQVDPTV